ncbi:MAG: hypothetical protein JF616_01925 [Fibrobacteres bacterium]|nr:hypothetical protein [Fibrobacterota bacterium]
MLGMKTYPKDYIAACKKRVDANVKAWRKQAGKPPDPEFEKRFFNDQTLLLDYMFVHRLSGAEGKDGNPLNEVRVLCNSLLLNDGKVQVEKKPDWPTSAVSGLKLPAEKSVLGLKNGDAIGLTEGDFLKLSKAFFTELERKYS